MTSRMWHAMSAGMLTAVMMAILPASASAASFTGRVLKPDGTPAFGAMVTVFQADRARRQTVYTDADGRYAIVTPFGGRLEVRARLANFEDVRTVVTATATSRTTVDLTLLPFVDAMAASNALAASAHNAKLPWDSERDRATFVSQCNYCHQMGNATTRIPRSHDQWLMTVRKMEGILAMLSEPETRGIASVLSRGFTGKPVSAAHDYGATSELARAKTEEWLLGDGYSFIHDMDVGQDGLFYGTDESHDVVWRLTPATGAIVKFKQPDAGLPRGGMFSGLKLPIGVFEGQHGPHSLAQTSDGRYWITNALSGTLMSFDPKTGAYRTYPVGHDARYPHTIRVDANDIVWFTVVATNQIGRFDPKTGQMTVVRLPSNGFVRWVSDQLFPTILRVASWFPGNALHLRFSHHKFLGYNVLAFPYGIDINPVDGSVWYAKLYANKIGRIDPATMQVTEYDTPMRGPRRPRFDAQGVLWIPAFDDGGLMAFDPRTTRFSTWKLPGVAAGEYETPYALNVQRSTGDVWVTANNSDRVLRFTPRTQTFQSYPSPMRVTVLRDLSFTRDGRVCSSSSNWPAYAIEERVPSFICFDPTGADRDREALLAGRTPR